MVRKDEEKGNNRAGHATFDQQLDNGTTLWKCNRRQLQYVAFRIVETVVACAQLW